MRLDVAFGVGVRQDLKDKSILALSLVATPSERKMWSDPYVEGEDRIETDLNQPGVRFRWGRMFKTGLEFTAQYRDFQYDDERSGTWLIGLNRLDPADQPLKDLEGGARSVQFGCTGSRKASTSSSRRIPRVNRDLDRAVMAHKGPSAQLTYLNLTPKLVLDFNLILHTQVADEVHPVYDTVLESDRCTFGCTAFWDLFRRQALHVPKSASIWFLTTPWWRSSVRGPT